MRKILLALAMLVGTMAPLEAQQILIEDTIVPAGTVFLGVPHPLNDPKLAGITNFSIDFTPVGLGVLTSCALTADGIIPPADWIIGSVISQQDCTGSGTATGSQSGGSIRINASPVGNGSIRVQLWGCVSTCSSSSGGGVSSVNGEGPDGGGNVELTASDVDAVTLDPTGDQTINGSDSFALILGGNDGTSFNMLSERTTLESAGNAEIISDVSGAEAEQKFFGSTANSETDFETNGDDFSITETTGQFSIESLGSMQFTIDGDSNLTLNASAGAGTIQLDTGAGGVAISGVAPELLLTDNGSGQTIGINPADPNDGNAPTITLGSQSDGIMIFEDLGIDSRGILLIDTAGNNIYEQLVGGQSTFAMTDVAGDQALLQLESGVPSLALRANGGASSGVLLPPAGNPVSVSLTEPDNSGVLALVGDDLSLNPAGDQTINTANSGGDLTFYGGHSAPTSPTVANVGTAGAVLYGYKITLATPTGETASSTEGATATGNATLDGTNYNTITVPTTTVPNATFNIYATTVGGNIATGGLIATGIAPGGTYNHQGAQGFPLFAAPSTDTSSGFYDDGNITINSDFRLIDTSNGTMAWISPNVFGTGNLGVYVGPESLLDVAGGSPYAILEDDLANGPSLNMADGGNSLNVEIEGGVPQIVVNSQQHLFPTIAGQFAVGSMGQCSNLTGCGNGTVTFIAPLWRVGDFTLSSGTKTVNTMPYTSGTSYFCSGNDLTSLAGVIGFTYTSGSNLTITETGGATSDHVRIMCTGT